MRWDTQHARDAEIWSWVQIPLVAQYIFNRCTRDFSSLFHVLDKLDKQSLQQKRKLTIPFVKEVMSW